MKDMSHENIDSNKTKPALSSLKIREELSKNIETMEALCAALEELADELPLHNNKQKILYLAHTVYPLICKAHHFEENIVFPLLEKNRDHSPNISDSLERLKSEHWEDESYAIEIHDELIEFVTSDEEVDSERLGYMLRGFFEGVRRHLAFEKEHILPMLGNLN